MAIKKEHDGCGCAIRECGRRMSSLSKHGGGDDLE
jgi:hypothetical protein